jgi:hypothetical protein
VRDQLLFLDAGGRRLYSATWIGPWPPPDKLLLMRGRQSGIVSVVEEGLAPADVVAAARELGTIDETRYRLRNCSQLPHAAEEGDSWFRGAEYVPEGDDA